VKKPDHVPGIFVPLEQPLIDKLRAVANPMTAEHLLEEIARTLALSSGDQASVTVPRDMAAMVYAFVSFMAEPQTDRDNKLIQRVMRGLFLRSEPKESQSDEFRS
jgi:hypothetical protein